HHTTPLGHAFTYTAFDVLIRYLRFLGRDVTYVRNVTDIDDDILLRARSREMHWKELGDREYAKFMADMQHLNNLPPECEPRATEHIPEIIRLIDGLLAKGCAYASDGNVYFDVKNYPNFGKLCGLSYVAQLAPLDSPRQALWRRAQDEQIARQHGLPRRPAPRLSTRCHPPLPPRPPLPRALEPRQTRACGRADSCAKVFAHA